jgi:hypothetical protein
MSSMNCPQCGAPMSNAPGLNTCQYCKRQVHVPEPQAAAPREDEIPKLYVVQMPVHQVSSPPPRSAASSLITLIIVLVTTAVPIFIVWRTFRSVGMPGVPAIPGIGDVSWDGRSPLVCSGNNHMTIEGKSVDLGGTVITAEGNCQLRLVRCNIKGGVAVEAKHNAVVTIEGGSVTGKRKALIATENATINVRGARVDGGVKQKNNAKINR